MVVKPLSLWQYYNRVSIIYIFIITLKEYHIFDLILDKAYAVKYEVKDEMC